MDRKTLWVAALFVLSAVGLVYGWHLFWFLCDDAFIAFRYVSNSQFGLGYTWNPPPFRPVEGYTSFLWVVILDYIWSWFGVEPPDSANWASLAFSLGMLVWIFKIGLQMKLSESLEPWRLPMLASVLFGTLTNRTFLAWTSSGLETAMFTFFLLGWFAFAANPRPGRAWTTTVVALASLITLSRPDGLLFLAATAAIVVARWWFQWKKGELGPIDAVVVLPVLGPFAHTMWRYSYYGYWLPNTYYAKHVGAWPLAGIQYLSAFCLEYGSWVFLVAAIAAGVALTARGALRKQWPLTESFCIRSFAVLAIIGQFVYYTALVGGDHFEFRIYQHLVPLILFGLWRVLDAAWGSVKVSAAAVVFMIAIGLPIPWIHWAHTHDLQVRTQTFKLRYQVAPHFPAPIRWYAEAWDELQHWMIGHFVGNRHQGHKVFWKDQMSRFPSREEGLKIDGKDFPVYAEVSVGVPAWTMPHVVILDKLGLNDAIVARSPAARTSQNRRMMAHDRRPPKGYLGCFRPNLEIKVDEPKKGTPLEKVNGRKTTVVITPRRKPLTEQEIRACESEFMARALESGAH